MRILLLLAALAPPVAAADRCVDLLDSALRTGDPAVADCFAPGTDWRDEKGLRSGERALEKGLGALLRKRPRLRRGGLVVGKSSSSVLVSGFWTPDPRSRGRTLWERVTRWFFPERAGRHLVLVVDSSPAGWAHARLYGSPAPWPAVSMTSTGRGGELWEWVLEGFNGEFSKGNVAGWVERFHPDAVFYSAIGPLEGPDIRGFFEKQAERYREPRLSLTREHYLRVDGMLMESEISGRCRSGGDGFAMKAVMLVSIKEEKIHRLHEAFTGATDGCGPFWTEDD